MTIYVDQIVDWGTKGRWCHMASDDSVEELHEFAQIIGMKLEWFQNHRRVPHYDLRPTIRKRAVANGAISVPARELFRRCALRIPA